MVSLTERTPLPNPQFYILLCIRFIEPISFTLVFPFIYFMVRDFGITNDEKEIAFYAGFVSAAFAVGEFLSGIPWGILSDRIGRKPVILLGLFGTMISMVCFGISKSLPWAILMRFLAGALNGNIGVLKSMVGEMTDRSNRALGFSYLSMGFGLGSILGPAFGGFLSHPVDNFPLIFGGNKFLTEYPYFLPCGICAVFDAIGIIFGYFYLEETLKTVKGSPQISASTAPLKGSDSSASLKSYGTVSASISHNSSSITLAEAGESRVPLEAISSSTWYVITTYIGISLVAVMMDELFPFWAATSTIYGGLGYLPADIGFISSILGAVLIFIQIFLYTPLQLRFSTLSLYRFSFILFAPVVASLPLVSWLVSEGYIRLSWWVLLFLLGLKTGFSVMAFTSHNILLPESCASKNTLGRVNGIAQSLGSLMRGIGPSLCGALWTWSLNNGFSYPLDYHMTFYVVSLLSCLTYLLVNRIKPEMLVH